MRVCVRACVRACVCVCVCVSVRACVRACVFKSTEVMCLMSVEAWLVPRETAAVSGACSACTTQPCPSLQCHSATKVSTSNHLKISTENNIVSSSNPPETPAV